MADRWRFSGERLLETPSRRCGLNPDGELAARQHTAEQINELGVQLGVSQLTISTAIVYMRRFYMFHSFTKFEGNAMAQAALFLAAKVEEQQIKLEHMLRMAHSQFKAQQPFPDPNSKTYLKLSQDIIMLESILLQTLGFDITIDHPHTHVLRCMQFVTASRDLTQTSYFMATNSLLLTNFCLQYKSTLVACVCIHFTCKWIGWQIPTASDGRHWWQHLDSSVLLSQIDELTFELLKNLKKTPLRIKRIRQWRTLQSQATRRPHSKPRLACGSTEVESSSGKTATTAAASSSHEKSSKSSLLETKCRPPVGKKHEVNAEEEQVERLRNIAAPGQESIAAVQDHQCLEPESRPALITGGEASTSSALQARGKIGEDAPERLEKFSVDMKHTQWQKRKQHQQQQQQHHKKRMDHTSEEYSSSDEKSMGVPLRGRS